jgi:U3 small nucleolar RNA-associated protein 20
MTPYLGKQRQKPFIARFAAESISFLIRKAALVYYKNKAPLDHAVSFLFEDLRNAADSQDVNVYKQGLMAMFSEAIKGVNAGVHSNGSEIVKCLIQHALLGDDVQSNLVNEVVVGVITNIIHNTSANAFAELINLIRVFVESEEGQHDKKGLMLSSRLIFVCVATRKGTRVKDWKGVHQSLLALLRRSLTTPDTHRSHMPRLLTAVAYALQLSPMDEMLPFMRSIMEAVADGRLSTFFLQFCATFSDFGAERFQIVVLPYFQR